MADWILDSLRGGINDFDPASSLEKDECTLAENVEFFYSTLGERRAGCVAMSGLPASITANPLLADVVWMFEHQPSASETSSELWAITRDTGTDAPIILRYAASVWSTITPSDVPILASGAGYQIYGQSLHGKLYIAYKSAVDRLHVWDGTSLRRVGLAQPAAPTAANTGGGTYPAVIRYYRVRYTTKSGATILRRSEPSTSVAFTPSGGGTAAQVTMPALLGEGETHWEVEVSLDNQAFYRLASTVVGTTTYDDSASVASYSSNTLSDEVDTYATVPSVKFLSSDGDRLLLGGSWTTTADASAVRWTPVGNDPNPGPDERLNLNTDPRVDLDGQEGGDMSGLARVVNGSMYAFKQKHVYKLIRTGQLVGAYEAIPVTKARGAFPRSLVEANDEAGRPAQYFVDPDVGPMRAGADGLQFLGYDIQTLWRRVNRAAILPCHGVFYNDKHQLHYWLALDGSDYPNTKIVLQTNEVRSDAVSGGHRGWSTIPSPSRIADARCSVMFAQSLSGGSLNKVPHIGKAAWTVSAATITDVIQRCDTGTTDAHTTGDTVSAYTAKVKTRPFFLTHILNRHGIMAAALLGTADSHVLVDVIRDFGTETLTFTADMTPTGSETHVIAQLDDLNVAELYAIQIQFEDDPDNASQWQLLQFAMRPRTEQTA